MVSTEDSECSQHAETIYIYKMMNMLIIGFFFLGDYAFSPLDICVSTVEEKTCLCQFGCQKVFI